jgi:hypothetical protein
MSEVSYLGDVVRRPQHDQERVDIKNIILVEHQLQSRPKASASPPLEAMRALFLLRIKYV